MIFTYFPLKNDILACLMVKVPVVRESHLLCRNGAVSRLPEFGEEN
jgi:hypothetical protein